MLTQSRKDAKENAKNAAWSPAGFAPLRLCVRNLFWSSIILLLVIPPPLLAQRTPQKPTGPTEEQLPAFAVSLVISLATEARSYSDVALRPRVLARAADVIWDADNVNARGVVAIFGLKFWCSALFADDGQRRQVSENWW
jgi:hypothetical protein